MNIEICEAPISSIDELELVRIAFTVDREYEVASNQGSGRFVLSERSVETPYVKDYDAIPGEGPSQWARRFDISRWGFIRAQSDSRLVGGVVLAFDTGVQGSRELTTARIVSARSDDLGRYIDLLEEVAEWLEARGIKQWRSGNFRRSAVYYAQSIELDQVRLAFVDDELVGTLRLLLHEPIVWPEVVEDDAVYVYNLAVRRSWASKRLGSQMLEWAEDRARALGRRYVRLDCMADNDFLRDYYVQAGFEERGEIDAPFPDPVGTLHLRRYEKRVRALMSLHVDIRPEEHGDVRDIWHITKQAFAGRPYADGTEQDIIDLLRDHGALAISLVAEIRGKIVGHVAFSPAVPEDLSSGWYTLGPVSVQPDVQRQGIGKVLIRAGIARLRELDAAGCIVLGNTSYYSQFGFIKAPELAPSGEPAEYFMVLSLGSQVPTCRIGFHDAFHHISNNKG